MKYNHILIVKMNSFVKKIIMRDVYCGKGHENEKINLQDKDNKDEKSLQCMLHGDELLKIATN